MSNRITIVIEGDESINPDLLHVKAPEDVDVVYFVKVDGLAPERLPVEIDKASVARIVFAIEMAEMCVAFQTTVAKMALLVQQALDRVEPDKDLAIEAIERIERECAAAKARIRGGSSRCLHQ